MYVVSVVAVDDVDLVKEYLLIVQKQTDTYIHINSVLWAYITGSCSGSGRPGAPKNGGFKIDRKTGVIRLDEVLDRESQNSHVLTVLAKNRGSARGYNIDEAQVKIQVNLSVHIKK